MSPPLVVAFALAGRVDIDLTSEPLGTDNERRARVPERHLALGHRGGRRAALLRRSRDATGVSTRNLGEANPLWNEIRGAAGSAYYVGRRPRPTSRSRRSSRSSDAAPAPVPPIRGARALAIFGDSVTTDHISPAGAIKKTSPAGLYLQSQGVAPADFNSYGARRGNDRVMTRGTFANVRIKNLMVPGVEGGVTIHQPSGERMSDLRRGDALSEGGRATGRLRGTGVRHGQLARLGRQGHAASRRAGRRRPELRAHSSLEPRRHGRPAAAVPEGTSPRRRSGSTAPRSSTSTRATVRCAPRQDATLTIRRADGRPETVALRVRIDTPIEVDYYRHGGILPFVLRQLIR